MADRAKNLLSWQHYWADTADGAILAYPPTVVPDECGRYCYADGVDCIAVAGLHGGVVEHVRTGAAVLAEISLELRAGAPSAASADTPDTVVSSVYH